MFIPRLINPAEDEILYSYLVRLSDANAFSYFADFIGSYLRPNSDMKLAKYFLDIRGVNGPNSKHYDYNQSHMPPAQQTEAVGHAVRATYMYSGMADVAAIMGAKEYQHAIDQIWNNVVDKKYYITGGIGALHSGEAFGSNYELPNATAYNETCAAIANVYWNWRMFLAYGDSKYYDVIERTLYNGVLSGISLSGDHFFYPNPLESNGGYSRSAWFGCACCPSNLCRFIPSVPGYVYAHRDDSVFVNLFIGSHAKIGLGGGRLMRLTQTTNYPWNGAVNLTIEQAPPTHVALKIRIPGWARNHPVPSNLYTYLDNKDNRDSVRLNVNGTPTPYRIEKGYMVVDRQWKAGDKLDFDLNMKVRRVVANDKLGADRGKVALERGPIVYCLEHADNNGEVLSSVVTDTATITAREDSTIFRLLPNHDMVVLDINGGEGTFNSDGSLTTKAKRLTAIPYYAWANREAGQMEVWMARTPDNTDVGARHISHTDTLKVNVGQVPASTASGAYPSVPVKADIAAVAKAFGISVSDVKNLYGSSITYAAIEPNGNVNTNSTAIAPGHWFAADGSVTNWDGTGTKSLVFSEFQPASFVFNIGQFPNSNHNGDSYIIRQALTYSPGNDAPRRVVFEFKVDFTNAQGVYNRELKVAKGFLNSQDYANVRGDEMTELRQAVTADASYNYTEATQNLYDAVAAFVDAKAAFDEYSDAADRAFKAPTQYPYATKEKLDDLADQIAASPESAYEASALTGTITKAYKAVVLSNADAESTGNSNNLVSNPDFANNNGHTADNWNIVTFTAGFKNITTDENYDTTNKPYFVNYGSWGQGTSAFDFKMSQTIQKVPAGRYLISLMSRGKDLDLYTLNITAIGLDTTVTLPFYGNTGQLFGNGWNSAYYLVDVHTDGDVTITATATASKDQTFTSLGRFRMLKLPYTTTGIQPTKKDQNGMQKTYNLNGQLMGNDQDDMNGLPQGIYIKSGRKVLTTPHTRAR